MIGKILTLLNLLALTGVKKEKLRHMEVTQKVQSQSAYSSSRKVEFHKDIRVELIGKNLTKFGGIQLVREFLRQLKVKEEDGQVDKTEVFIDSTEAC
ncbi:MAG TPA: hypothetical protein VHT73_16000 [Thermodesulfobacteriota bacterium]|nr:hypothetical protein [Thermodesulfobacteriota bacterium]